MAERTEDGGTDRPGTAGEWLLALIERPDDAALRAAFETWIAADPANATDWAEMARTYAVIGRVAPLHAAHWAPAQPLPPPRRVTGRRLVGMAAVAAMAACLTFVFLPHLVLHWRADHVTGTGETRQVRLADGSILRLGPHSAVAIGREADERRIHLLAGRAFFDVVPDATRPFRVDAETVETTVLGTAFEVALDERGTGVAVRTGSVQVRDRRAVPTVTQTLTAGNWTMRRKDGAGTRGTMPPDDVAPWLEARLIAKDRPVGAVVDDLRGYYRGIVLLHGDRLVRQPLTGVYDLSNPAGALRAIANAQGASLYQLSPWVMVIAGD